MEVGGTCRRVGGRLELTKVDGNHTGRPKEREKKKKKTTQDFWKLLESEPPIKEHTGVGTRPL